MAPPSFPSLLYGTALADDDDDDDNDGDDDDDRPRGRPARPAPDARPAPPAPSPAAPSWVSAEIVALVPDGVTIAPLEESGFRILERAPLPLAGGDLVLLAPPPGLPLDMARDRALAAIPGAVVDLNHFYAPEADGPALMREVVNWPAPPLLTCAPPERPIGLIDTAINADHAAFRGAKLELVRLSRDQVQASGQQHGTAVAALLIGGAEGPVPGLLPGARLIAVDAFQRSNGDHDRATTHDLIRAIDLLAIRRVSVINMSLAGPANRLLELVIARAAAQGIVLVAAAGNDGPAAAPLYPAAHPETLAVTAVDRSRQPYRRAARGAHIDLAAPGVEVWVAAAIQGARAKSGTSFAAPFVTAAVALLNATRHDLTPAGIAALLAHSAEDLGAPGKDEVFGWGLLRGDGLCAPAKP